MDALVDQLFRRQSGRLVGVLTRQLGSQRLSLAEDAVQDALVKALQTWPVAGVPDNPEAWLFQVARRAALDRLRHQRVVEAKADAVAAAREASEVVLLDTAVPFEDDELAMMFMTCHPALTPDARVALTLKVVGGFGVGEIARAFLMQDRRWPSVSCGPSARCASTTCRSRFRRPARSASVWPRSSTPST